MVELSSYKSCIKEAHYPVKIVIEQIDGVTIGREDLEVVSPLARWEPSTQVIELINMLNKDDSRSERQRQILRFTLNNNSPNDSKGLEHERAVSAYFTYNPKNETVIVEYGTINPKTSEAKLHTYLNRMIDYRDRATRGMKISSGHLAETKSGLYLAFFDNLLYPHTELIHARSPMGKTINTLYANNFVIVAANGYVQLPAF